MSEGKTFTPILRDGGNPATLGITVPSLPPKVTAYGGALKLDSGHVEWIDARGIQSGFTTTFPPNTRVPYMSSGITYDVDFTSYREGKTAAIPTYSAVTARSYHAGGVNALLMDGSVRFVGETISQAVWRALGTRSGCEFVGDF
jgi:prepilin-type processing-associated H-X9-DG protein